MGTGESQQRGVLWRWPPLALILVQPPEERREVCLSTLHGGGSRASKKHQRRLPCVGPGRFCECSLLHLAWCVSRALRGCSLLQTRKLTGGKQERVVHLGEELLRCSQ